MCKLYFLMILCASVPNYELQAIDWCELNCVTPTGSIKNTMCKYPERESVYGCHYIRDSRTPTAIKEILDRHNTYRNAIAGGEKDWPSAANMPQMTWDMALEALALRWAQQCVPKDDECRRTSDFYTVGQNYCVLANWKYYVDGPQDCFQGWTNGINLTTPKILNSFEGGGWAHFSQIIWGNSYKLGCAEVQFRQSWKGVRWKKTALVCNYGPGGNLVGEKIYETGDPCSQCPSNTTCRNNSSYPKLCALSDDPNGPQDIIEDNEYSPRKILHRPGKNGAGITKTFTFGDVSSLLSDYIEYYKIEGRNYASVISLVPIMMAIIHLTVKVALSLYLPV